MKDPIYHLKTKHVGIHHHRIREQARNKEMELIYCIPRSGGRHLHQVLNKNKFENFREMLEVVENDINFKRGYWIF